MFTLPKVLWGNSTCSAHLNLFNVPDDGLLTIKFMRPDSNVTAWEQKEKIKGGKNGVIIYSLFSSSSFRYKYVLLRTKANVMYSYAGRFFLSIIIGHSSL